MADYDCWPLWEEEPEIGNVDPAALPIGRDLQDRLAEWQRQFDATLNREDPSESGFDSTEAEARHHDEGRTLAADMRAELGEGVIVRYWLDDPVG